ncbi:hypothetical protein [Streptomyces sp. NPDC054794]
MPAPQEPARPPSRPPMFGSLEKAAYILAPGTVVVGLLYYFGSVYTKAYYTALGVLPEDLGFSVQSILANSASAIFFPLWLLLMCGLIVLLALGWVGHRLALPAHAARRRTAIRWLGAVGLVMVLLSSPVFYSDRLLFPLPEGRPRQFAPCLVMALGATLAFFAVQLRLGQGTGMGNPQARTSDRLWLAGGALLIGVLTMSLFFDMARYARAVGRGNAIAETKRGYRDSPWVVVHSRVPLPHHAKNITPFDLGSRSGPYRYEYRGFRIVAKSQTRYYLVSYSSSYDDRDVVVLPDNDNLWVEIRGS